MVFKHQCRFLSHLFELFRFQKIEDFQAVTMAGFEIAALLDIDKPVERLLPSLYLKFQRCPSFNNQKRRESLESLSPARIRFIRAQVRDAMNLHFYSTEFFEDPEKLKRLDRARNYDL